MRSTNRPIAVITDRNAIQRAITTSGVVADWAECGTENSGGAPGAGPTANV